MSDLGVRPSSFKSGQLIQFRVDYIRSPTLKGHNSFVRTPIRVFLDYMEIPLSQESINMPEEDRIFQTKVLDRAHRGQVSSSGLTT